MEPNQQAKEQLRISSVKKEEYFERDLLFAERNRRYGAYRHRKNYNRHIAVAAISTVLVIGISLFFHFFSYLFKSQASLDDLTTAQIRQLQEPARTAEIHLSPPPPPPPPPEPSLKKVPILIDSTPPPKPKPKPKPKKVDEATTEPEDSASTAAGSGGGSDTLSGSRTGNGSEGGALASLERKSQYKTGQRGWQNYLRKNLQYPKYEKVLGIQGVVTIRFILNTSGTFDDVVVERKLNEKLDAEAIRLVKESEGDWVVAMQHGEPVRTVVKVDVPFYIGMR